ncbi:MAG: Maf family protein [Oceanospirillaceae bacterium]
MQKELILASASPRRKQLLSDLGVSFGVVSADIDEAVLLNEQPANYVSRLALQKAQKVLSANEHSIVLGSDTCVVIDQKILGKPESEEDALQMLLSLSGRWHQVLTAVAVISNNQVRQVLVSTQVEFCHLDEQVCHAYWQTNEPQDKAGSYAIQGIGGRFVRQIKGSFSAVVGLPVAETAELLCAFEIDFWKF